MAAGWVRTGLAVLSLIAMVAPAAAQTINRAASELLGAIEVPIEQQNTSTLNLRLGVGAVFSSRLDAASNLRVYPLPLVSFEYHNWLSVDETQARLNLVDSDSALARAGFRAGPMVRIDPGRGNVSRPGISGLGKVPVSLEAGAFVSYTFGPARVRLRLRRDVTDAHGGSVGEFDVRTGLYKSGPLGIGAQAQTVWGSRNYLEKTYGVTPAQSATSRLPVYHLDAGMKDVNVTVYAEYKFSERWSAIGALQFVHVLSAAADSPIIRTRGSGNRANIGLFVVYAFGGPKT